MQVQHVFLTGDVQVGKSTLIGRFVEQHPELSVGGFQTVSKPLDEKQIGVYMIPAFSKKAACDAASLVGIRFPGASAMGDAAAFDRIGPALLDDSCCDLLIMDELGTMEKDARHFTAAVLAALGKETPILGVIKPKSTPICDEVRQCPHVRLLTVTRENRDDILKVLQAAFFSG